MNKIVRVEAFPLQYPEPNNDNKIRYVTLARIETSDGIVGWGECISQWPEASLAVKTIIDAGFAKLLIGEDGTQAGRLWQKMRNHAYWHGFGGIVSFAISALDTALWDIAGKAAGLPISAMLGGKLMDRVPSCSSVILNTLDLGALKEEFISYRERGFSAVKGGWGQVPEAGFGTNRVRDMKVARTVREAIGPDMGMALDVSALAKWSASHAATMAEELQEVNLTWLEDALHHDDHEGYRQMKSRVPTALATGERCWTLHDYQRLVRSNAIDIILVDPGRIEGISGMKAIVDDALTQRVRFVPHSWSSAINTAASLHVYAASTNGEVFEIKPAPSPMQNELVENPIEQKDGWIAVPDTPGLGITINEKAIKKYLYQG